MTTLIVTLAIFYAFGILVRGLFGFLIYVDARGDEKLYDSDDYAVRHADAQAAKVKGAHMILSAPAWPVLAGRFMLEVLADAQKVEDER